MGEEKGGEGGGGKLIGVHQIGSTLQFYPRALASFCEAKKFPPPLHASRWAWRAEEQERGDELHGKDN